jgi:ABC-2 type transport system ATP-binding protein
METSAVIRVEGVSKSFGDTEAVRDLSFAVQPGSIFGLLGLNGSGKTTTIRLLLGLLRPDKGSAYLFGEDCRRLSRACRQRVGYLSEEPFPYQSWSLEQVLRFVATFFPAWDWDHTNALAKRFGVPTRQTLASMSAGQRRLAELLLVLAQKPDLLILDDPAVGLDVMVRREFLWAALEIARDEGKAVLFTSHILTDVERVCDTIGIVHQGRMRVLAELEDLKTRTRRIVLPPESTKALEVKEPLPGEVARRVEQGSLVVVIENCTPLHEAELIARFPGVEIEGLNLEDVFCELVGQPAPPKEEVPS